MCTRNSGIDLVVINDLLSDLSIKYTYIIYLLHLRLVSY